MNFSHGRRARCVRARIARTVAATAALAVPCVSRAATTLWTGTTGDFFASTNWSAGVPGPLDLAEIAHNGTAQISGGSADVATLALGGLNVSGRTGAGTLVHTGGQLSVNVLELGNGNGSGGYFGTYQLSNTAVLNVTTTEAVGFGFPGTFFQTGGTATVAGSLSLGLNAYGNYQMGGGTLRVNALRAGDNFTGDLLQTAGAVVGIDSAATLTVGRLANATYTLQDGTISIANQNVGDRTNGSGTFYQTGGTNTATTLLSIKAKGRYNLSGGTLVVGNLMATGTLAFAAGGQLLYSGVADFTQATTISRDQANVTGLATSLLLLPTGSDPATYFGTFSTAGLTHVLGTALDIPAGYSISGLATITDPTTVEGSVSGIAFNGSLTVSGGNVDSPSVLIKNASSGITAGSLTSTLLNVGDPFVSAPGTFTQSAGSVTVDALYVNPGSRYAMTGGALTVQRALVNIGTLDFTGASNATLTVGGIADLSNTIAPQLLDVVEQANTLLLLPPGFNPVTQFKSFSNAGGLVHAVGSPLTIPAGMSIWGGGYIIDPLTVNGSLSAYSTATGIVINAGKGIVVNSGAIADLGGVVSINDATSAINDGARLGASALTIGVTQPGAITLAGNQTTTARTVDVGLLKLGSMTQTGGTLNLAGGGLPRLTLGSGPGVAGYYQLIDGTITTPVLNSSATAVIGSGGEGHFVQQGGTHVVTGMVIADQTGSVGTYDMNGGALVGQGPFTPGSLGVGSLGSATFTQRGGTVSVGNVTISVTGTPAASSTYDLEAGQLNATNLSVADKGSFIQNGGTIGSATARVPLTVNPFSKGAQYALNSGIAFFAAVDAGIFQAPGIEILQTGGTFSAQSETSHNGEIVHRGGGHSVSGEFNQTGSLTHSSSPGGTGTFTAGTFRITGLSSTLIFELDPDLLLSPITVTGAGSTPFGGKLNIVLPSGAAHVDGSATYTLLTTTAASNTIFGSFSNVASGSRLTTVGGEGSFLVTYGGHNLTISNFQALPEPSTITLITLAGAVALRRRRRRV